MGLGLREICEIGGFALVAVGFIVNLYETNRIKSNCIATLEARVTETERKQEALFAKLDRHEGYITDIKVGIAKLSQQLEDFNGKS